MNSAIIPGDTGGLAIPLATAMPSNPDLRHPARCGRRPGAVRTDLAASSMEDTVSLTLSEFERAKAESENFILVVIW
jgi:hypothetical protein